MLMQNFMSAADLGLTEQQKEALMKTLVLLETDKLVHVPNHDTLPRPNRFVPTGERQFSGQFNMADWNFAHNCGTVCCIGGTAEMIGGVSLDEDGNDGLYQLFYPQFDGCKGKSYSSITTSEAATALRSYLTTGDARWDLAVS